MVRVVGWRPSHRRPEARRAPGAFQFRGTARGLLRFGFRVSLKRAVFGAKPRFLPILRIRRAILRIRNAVLRIRNEPLRIRNEPLRIRNAALRRADAALRIRCEPLRIRNEPLRIRNATLRIRNGALRRADAALRIRNAPLRRADGALRNGIGRVPIFEDCDGGLAATFASHSGALKMQAALCNGSGGRPLHWILGELNGHEKVNVKTPLLSM